MLFIPQKRSRGILQTLQEIFRRFLSSINIEHYPKYIKKVALITVHVVVRSYKLSSHMRDAKFELFTKVPFARSRKHDFPNINKDDLLSNALD